MDMIKNTIFSALGLAMLTVQIWAINQDEIKRLSEECLTGNQKSCTRLADIARKDEEWSSREAAVKKLTDQSILAEVIRKDENGLVCQAALENSYFTDQALLGEVAKYGKYDQLRMLAADKLTDKSLAQTVYADIAKNNNNSFIRATALEKITDPNLLDDVKKNCKYPDDQGASEGKNTGEIQSPVDPRKDPRNIDTMIDSLNDRDPMYRVGPANVLAETNDPRATDALLSALKRKDLVVIAAASSFFIRRGQSGTEALLIEALQECDNIITGGNKNKKMNTHFSQSVSVAIAENLLHCGNPKLEQAAQDWSRKTTTILSDKPNGPKWGEQPE